VTDPANSIASFGWHDTNGVSGVEYTITRGNNVWAKDFMEPTKMMVQVQMEVR
jgi:hypothetical protein